MDSGTVAARLDAIRGGVLFRTLRAEEIKVTFSGDAEIKRAMSCRIVYDPELDLMNDRLRPYQIVGGVEYPLGEFLASTAPEEISSAGRGWRVEAYDQSLLLQQATTIEPLRFAAGTGYLEAVQSLLASCGIDRVIVEPSALTLAADREDWEIGTSYLSVANELLAAINYASLWFDSSGYARLGRIKAAVAENVTKVYASGQYSILCDGMTRTADTYTAYNFFTAVYSSPDAPPMVASAVNDSPLSPISTVRRGRKICAPVEFVDDIASADELQAYADNLKTASLMAAEVVEFETAPLPTHEAGEIIALEGEVLRETEWSLSLGFDGEFRHKARKVVVL